MENKKFQIKTEKVKTTLKKIALIAFGALFLTACEISIKLPPNAWKFTHFGR
ncbi:MAG: hypothetical protein US40_C0008G0006 [Candidatus Roizmanbacteria bacterium GW2011_GWC2_37_13]|uniref:Lipoprotein n=1 Tax=Candidatus Roizmanbacteria bacterium GW2011_GWC2_37_13 TaxID=1618486 RepID=A0A0G0G5T3_9BACT|nr:MAG: hypothetical protein US38_C0003G0006 [Candidatus Roizmanbacteria bacterium GW2011_GWC1_37_12]KKQ25412.1 MAG: hypothetical protein US40_C0008G0006 [Candidatus Roizmanbacteria bacterium GW2011_GWC2_37_13]